MGRIIVRSKKFGEKVILFDDQDYELISHYKWYLKKSYKSKPEKYYAATNVYTGVFSKKIEMHRLLMDFPIKKQVDHINGDGLDNRRNNLRVATCAENTKNRFITCRNTSGYKGVHLHRTGKYNAQIMVNYKLISGGLFKSVIGAALRYNELAFKYHGEFANLNKIDESDILKYKSSRNTDHIYQTNSTGHRGVSVINSKKSKMYRATIYDKVSKRNIVIGKFHDVNAAAQAYNNAAIKLFGEFAKLNPIPNEC